MRTPHATTPALAALLLLLCCHACGDPAVLDLTVVTPEGTDPFTGADAVRLWVSNPASSTSSQISNASDVSLELDIEVESAAGTITLEALAKGKLLARGETPPMILRPADQQLSLMVARAGELSTLRPRLASTAIGMASTVLPSLGVLLAGGKDGGGAAVSTASAYNFFTHKVEPLPALPAARAGAVAARCGSTCGVVALGGDGAGLATTMVRYDGKSWASYKDGLDPATRRTGAGLASLGDGTYLVAGGAGAGGTALDTFLRLRPGTVASSPTLEALPSRARAARKSPALAVGTGAVVIAGGQAKGEGSCEVFFLATLSSRAVTLAGGADLASGAAAATLSDGRVALVGGRDHAGALLRDAWIVDPSTLQVTHVKEALSAGRADHRVIRVDTHLVVVGGRVDAGLATQAELLDAGTLKSLRKVTMLTPRAGHSLQLLGVRGGGAGRSLLVAGGADGKGLVKQMEIYQTSVPQK